MVKRSVVILLCSALLAAVFGLTAKAGSTDAAADRKAHEQAAEKKLDELDKSMQELETDPGKGSQTRQEINRLYEEFKDRQGTAREDLERLRRSTNETWDKAKARMDKALQDLDGLYERTKKTVEDRRTGEKQ